MEGEKCWSLQLEGDLDQMASPLLQMYFTFPYLPLAHSGTVTDRPYRSRSVCGVGGPALGLDPAWQIQYSTAPPPLRTDAALHQLMKIRFWAIGLKLPTHFSRCVSAKGKYSQEAAYLERRWGLGEWKTLFVFAKQLGSRWTLRDPGLSISLFLLSPRVTPPEYLFSCCTV